MSSLLQRRIAAKRAARQLQAIPLNGKLLVAAHGMWGVGDVIHQRAVLREMMKKNQVIIETANVAPLHDLIDDGLLIAHRGATLPRIRESMAAVRYNVPSKTPRVKIGYSGLTVRGCGSILAAQFASVGFKMPERPDFSMPVKAEWRAKARQWLGNPSKPVMVYRPIVSNTTWACPARAPDPDSYDILYRSIRGRFFVASVADISPGKEWIVGPKPDVDLAFHNGELDFETLAGVFAEASMVFANPGFAPVLAQSVGTPVVIVYGGNESYRTTNSVGAHLAPTLAIEPITPCECHSRYHDCDKTIDMGPALEKLSEFAKVGAPLRVLIFGTTYVDSPERARLTEQWVDLHRAINPGCDFLLVDSASPVTPLCFAAKHENLKVHSFPDNIGHLAKGGRDGWGRAFCFGLQYAIDHGYDYVVHIEGDSLFRLPVMDIVRDMREASEPVASTRVSGTRKQETGWVETGLMVFDVGYLSRSNFIQRYEWGGVKPYPNCPEKVIYGLLGDDLVMKPWRAERGDSGNITSSNVVNLDWVTHATRDAFDQFANSYLPLNYRLTMAPKAEPVKINLGCGTNKLDGWRNHDADVDITKRLPFDDASVDAILAEHCVEHIDYYSALRFFAECKRVLKPGGVLRVCVPDIDRIRRLGDQEYFDFAKRWAKTADLRGALLAMVTCHGHADAWTQNRLEASLVACGFDRVVACNPNESEHPMLADVDGHGRVIGERNNWIETAIVEATA